MSKIKNSIKTAALTISIIGAFIGSWVFIQKQTKLRQVDMTSEHSKKPNAFSHKVVYRDIDKKGHLKNQLESDQLTHYAEKNDAELQKPVFTLHSEEKSGIKNAAPNKMPWHVAADRAETLNGGKIIKLYGNVSIDQEGDKSTPEKHLRTESLTIYPKENRLETKHPVKLWQPDVMIQAVGLSADLNKDVVHFSSKTHIIYKSPKSKDSNAPEEKHLETNQLTFHPKANFAQSHDDVILRQSGTLIRAKGFKADLNQNAVTFLSNTRIVYTPDNTAEKPTKKKKS